MSTPFHELDSTQQADLMRAAGLDALRRHWQIDGVRPELIKYRENAVFRIDHDGVPSALRVHRCGYHSDDALRSEMQWIRALDAFGIAVPTVIPTRDGADFAVVELPGLPGPVQVDRFAWIEGEQLGSVEGGLDEPAAVADTYRTLGRMAARVHNQASAWTPPAGFTRHAWDADGLVGERPLWGRFWELEAASEPQRRTLRRCRKRLQADLAALPRDSDVYSMIHADFAPENLMVSGEEVRLIDFDDAGFGWHMFEIATALYFIHEEPFFDAARDAMIEGYREHRELGDDEIARLALHMVTRSTTYLGWVHTRRGTETAEELTPILLEMSLGLAEAYLGDG